MKEKKMKIISGGQTGADEGGLEAGLLLNLETGGHCPWNCRTENGQNTDLLYKYHLVEDTNWEYPPRTEKNIQNSDGTLIVGKLVERGTALTRKLCDKFSKPCWVVPFPNRDIMKEEFFSVWLEQHKIQILNVAGNRESKNPGIQEFVRNWLAEQLKSYLGL